MSMNPPPAPLVDFSGMFSKLLGTLQLILAGMKKLVEIGEREEGTFASYAGGGQEMPLQKGVNGTVRFIHNLSATAGTLILVDGMESPLFGSAAEPIAIAAGAFAYVFIPYKNGLRAIGTGGYFIVAGETNS
jgi:hypothetical protein